MITAPSAIVALTLTVSTFLVEPDPGRLLTTAEIKSVLGGAPSGGVPHGPAIDRESGAKTWSCNYQRARDLLSINIIEYPSAAGAAKGMTELMQKSKDVEEAMKLAEAPGPGSRAAWGASEEGAMWVSLQGKYLLNVTFAGELSDPPRLREPLKRLTTLALAKLGS